MKAIADRFESSYIPVTESGCWLWLGETTSGTHGYGLMLVNGKKQRAHRVSFALYIGEAPTGLNICHRCDTPSCVNPAHLFAASQRDNIRDMNSKGRGKSGITNRSKTHCVRGHDLSNSYVVAGRRVCKKCNTIRCVNNARKRRAK